MLQYELSQVRDQNGERIEMIISVASGKGGTGKTLVATSLALSLKDRERIQLLDCDVEEPNDHIFLKPLITGSEAVCIPIPEVDEKKDSLKKWGLLNGLSVFHNQ